MRNQIIVAGFLILGLLSAGCSGSPSSVATRAQGGSERPVDAELARQARSFGLTEVVPRELIAACRELAARSRAQGAARPLYCLPLVPKVASYTLELAGGLDGYENVGQSTVIAVKSDSARSEAAFGGHWSFAEGEPGTVIGSYLPPQPGRTITHARLERRAVTIYRFPDGSGFYGGHIVIEWLQRGIAFQVSMHGQRNLQPLKLMVRALMREVALCPAQSSPPRGAAACRRVFYG